MRPIQPMLALLVLIPPGCGGAAPESAARYSNAFGPPTEERSLPAPAGLDDGPLARPDMMSAAMLPGAPAQDDAPPLDEAAAPLARKIIYDAEIDLVVEDIDPVAEQIIELVERHGGYVADQDLSGSPGSRRSGRWKIRVPVDRFEDLTREILQFGELHRNRRTSQDVTEQFYDIEARLRNKRVEESTLLEILEERGGKLEDVLKVEVELSRVRGEIEQLEGRLRVLESLSSLATITLSVNEREDYEPTPPVAPSFGTRIARQWEASIDGLLTLGEAIVLFAVGLAPWLPLIAVSLVVAIILLRGLLRALPWLREQARRPIIPPRQSS